MSVKCKPRIATNCLWCGNELQTLESQISRGNGQYCSRSCKMFHYHARNGQGSYTICCPICGTTKIIRKSHKDIELTCGKKECTKEYRWRTLLAEIEQKIGKSLEDILFQLYAVDHKSVREIHSILSLNNRTITKALRRFNIPIREGGEAVSMQWKNNTNRRKSQAELTKQRFAHQKGEQHPCWRGGISFKYDTSEWIKIANKVRRRDNNLCQRCGISNEECVQQYDKSLEVHHIIPYKFSRDNSLGNLMALCPSCHHIIEWQFVWLL